MKVFVVFVLLAVLLLSACSAPAATVAASVAPAASSAPAASASAQPSATPSQASATASASASAASSGPAAPALTEADLVFTLKGTAYTLKTDAKPFLTALGKDFELSSAPSCLYQGDDKTFAYTDVTVLTFPQGEKDIIDEIDITGGDYATERGVKIGGTLDDIRKAYGSGYYDDGGVIEYNLSGDHTDEKSPMLYFQLTDGKISCIGLYSASNVQ